MKRKSNTYLKKRRKNDLGSTSFYVISKIITAEDTRVLKEFALKRRPDLVYSYNEFDHMPEWLFYRMLINKRTLNEMEVSLLSYQESMRGSSIRDKIYEDCIKLLEKMIDIEKSKGDKKEWKAS